MTAVAFDLSQIAALGAISILLVDAVVHIDQTRANPIVVGLALLVSLDAIALSVIDATKTSTTPRTRGRQPVAATQMPGVRPGCSRGHSQTHWLRPSCMGAAPRDRYASASLIGFEVEATDGSI